MDPQAAIEAFAAMFSPGRRDAGMRLHQSGAVQQLEGDPRTGELTGVVLDPRLKKGRARVYAALHAQTPTLACDCMGPQQCEHVLALMLQFFEQLGNGEQPAAMQKASPVVKKPRAVKPEAKPAPLRIVTPRPSARPWSERLEDIEFDPDGEDAERTESSVEPVLYLVGVEAVRKSGRLCLSPTKHRIENGRHMLVTIGKDAHGSDLSAEDRSMINLLDAVHESNPKSSPARYCIPPSLTDSIVPMLFRTDRVQSVDESGPDAGTAEVLLLDDGPPLTFRLRLERTKDEVHVHGELARGDEVHGFGTVRAMLSAGYAQIDDRFCKVAIAEAVPVARSLLQDGPLRCDALDARHMVSSILEQIRIDRHVAPPLMIRMAAPTSLALVAHVQRPMQKHVPCEIQFDYGGQLVAIEDPLLLGDFDDTGCSARDLGAEEAALHRFLGEHREEFETTGFDSMLLLPRKGTMAALSRLVARGVRVLVDGKPMLRSSGTRVSVTTGVDWFDVAGAVQFEDGAEIPLAMALLAARRGERLVELEGGKTGVLPEELAKRLGPLLTLGEETDDGIRMRGSQAMMLDALLDARAAEVVRTDAGFTSIRERLGSFRGVQPQLPPKGFRGELRPYQQLGLGWLHFLRELGLGGCLADDMGLGKTVQVLALLQHVHGEGRRGLPSLLVVPRSLLDNWQREAARFTPTLRVLLFVGADRWETTPPEVLCEYDLVVTTYGTLRLDVQRFDEAQITFEYAILDEAQAIENETSLTSKAVRLLRATHRLALTGTPVQNHIGELWALFEFLTPGLLGKSRAFRELVGAGGRATADPTLLQRALAPFLLRRTKDQVLPELPKKQEQALVCELEGTQRKAYDALREHYRKVLLSGGSALEAKERFVALEALLRLRQAACHEGLVDPRKLARDSAKLSVLVPMLSELAASGHKALVFSQFTSFLDLVKQKLDASKVRYEYLDGSTRDRQSCVDRFQGEKDCPVFLISLKAGGFGLNLTAADYVFLLDPWWNPAAEDQAADRAHRIGQQRKVTVYRLIAKDTVEEKVLHLQTKKRALVESVLGADQSLLAELTRDDLRDLLT